MFVTKSSCASKLEDTLEHQESKVKGQSSDLLPNPGWRYRLSKFHTVKLSNKKKYKPEGHIFKFWVGSGYHFLGSRGCVIFLLTGFSSKMEILIPTCVRASYVISVTSDSLQPYGLCSLPGSSVQTVLPCPPPEDLPDPGIEPGSPALQADTLLLSHQGNPKPT